MEEWQPSLWGRKAGGKEPSNFAASWKGYPGKDRNGRDSDWQGIEQPRRTYHAEQGKGPGKQGKAPRNHSGWGDEAGDSRWGALRDDADARPGNKGKKGKGAEKADDRYDMQWRSEKVSAQNIGSEWWKEEKSGKGGPRGFTKGNRNEEKQHNDWGRSEEKHRRDWGSEHAERDAWNTQTTAKPKGNGKGGCKGSASKGYASREEVPKGKGKQARLDEAEPWTSSSTSKGKGKSHGKEKGSTMPVDVDNGDEVQARPAVAKDFMTNERFDELKISSESKRGIREVLGYEYLTLVQSGALPQISKGSDCLAKAKTGTGKTLAFLIPTVEILLKVGKGSNAVHSLVLAPTRELATQIAKEADALMRYQNMNIVCVIGGTNINKDKSQLARRVDLLIATPGRMNDHLDNTAGFGERCQSIRVLIMDEADQLLEMGFKPAIDKILSYMPEKKYRQTLLFSATIPPLVRQIADQALCTGYAVVDTVGEEVEQTHEHVRQQLLVLPVAQQIAGVAAVLSQFAQDPPYKVIVFFTTARVAGFMAEIFNVIGMPCPVLEMHSRKSQAQRTKTSEMFRKPGNKILFSSDVSARGMDYPDVTHVLQVGLTDREQYIHRLGRTARAGKGGEGLLLLAPFEERSMMRDLSDMRIERMSPQSFSVSNHEKRCNNGLWSVQSSQELRASAEKAYSAWLGFYNSNLKKCGWDKVKLVQEANAYAETIGLEEPPMLQKKTVGQMGLTGTPGLRIAGKQSW